MGTETNFTRESREKSLPGLENGLIFEKAGDSFQPGIQQEQEGNQGENHACHGTAFDPDCTVPIKENQWNKPERCEAHQNHVNQNVTHNPEGLGLKPDLHAIHLGDFARKPVSKYAANHRKQGKKHQDIANRNRTAKSA